MSSVGDGQGERMLSAGGQPAPSSAVAEWETEIRPGHKVRSVWKMATQKVITPAVTGVFQ